MQVTLLLTGKGASAAAAAAAKIAGVSKVLHSEDAVVDNGLAEGLSKLIVEMQKKNSEPRRISNSRLTVN